MPDAHGLGACRARCRVCRRVSRVAVDPSLGSHCVPMDWYIDLQDWMKLNSFVQTGGEAKQVIQAGQVTVNGEVVTERRRKLRVGDVVECAGRRGVVEPESQTR